MWMNCQGIRFVMLCQNIVYMVHIQTWVFPIERLDIPTYKHIYVIPLDIPILSILYHYLTTLSQ